ncbi:MAG: methylated-DNA--[Anaerotignum sp.]|nr:methylated-DNA--[protein]-cysteine S-methyltransferase [Anaerotignum sp.]
AGMGGGTGTGAAPVVASVARELDILTVGIVTMPFSFEGKRRYQQAREGIEELRKYVDALLVISNDKLRTEYGNMKLSEAFKKADDVLKTAAKGIAEIITVPGYVNVDFKDVNTVMRRSGKAIMGSGYAEGEGRALTAAEMAVHSPLLDDSDIKGAKNILVYIASGSEEVSLDEVTEIVEYIQEETELILKCKNQLDEYFKGKRKTFDLPLAPKGTEFQKKVWDALRDIPYGETRTYGEIAETVGNSKAARAVGMANNRNPIAIIVPCHRVVGASGKLVGYAGGMEQKEKLLHLEKTGESIL